MCVCVCGGGGGGVGGCDVIFNITAGGGGGVTTIFLFWRGVTV